jgi:hypothetical protein
MQCAFGAHARSPSRRASRGIYKTLRMSAVCGVATRRVYKFPAPGPTPQRKSVGALVIEKSGRSVAISGPQTFAGFFGNFVVFRIEPCRWRPCRDS